MAAAPCSCGIAAIWESDDPDRGFKKGDLKFTLHGDKLHGSWVLVRMKGDRYGGKRTNWLLIKHRDEFAKEGEANDILDEDRSVASGRSMAQIAQGKGKAPKPFMLAKGQDQSRRGLAIEPRRCGRGAGRRQDGGAASRARDQDARTGAGARPKKVSAMPDFVAPQLCASVERPPNSRRLVPRDQVRRLSRAIAGRGRRGRAEHPQGAGLDRKVRRHRQGSEVASRCADRRRDRRARSQRRAGFFGAAGGDCPTARPTT